jgi:RNA polymerase sigma-70 factor (ECF subfamily)
VADQITDSMLMERVRDSDRDAFRTLFFRHQPAVYRQALFHLGDADQAHDVVQETFLRIWEKRTELRPELSFLGLVLRVGGNIGLDAIRRKSRHRKLEGDLPLPEISEGDDPEQSLRVKLLEAELRRVVATKLAGRAGLVFVLCRLEEKTYREAAAILGITEKTVENHMNAALRVIRKELRHIRQ